MASLSANTCLASTRSAGAAKSASWNRSAGRGAGAGSWAQAAASRQTMNTRLGMAAKLYAWPHVSPKRAQATPARRQARPRLLDGARRAAGDRAPRALRLRLPAARPGARLRRALGAAAFAPGHGGDAALHFRGPGAVERPQLPEARA